MGTSTREAAVLRYVRALPVAVVVLSSVFLTPEEANAASDDRYTQTRYPIVLVPGAGGFDKLFGAVDYFNGIANELRDGGAEVYTLEQPAFSSMDDRGERLLEMLEYISAISGSPKLNVIGHSQGGLDARYAMAARPDLFASVTTIGSPHKGAPIASFIANNTTPNGPTQTVLSVLVNATGTIINLLSGSSLAQDSIGMMHSMTVEGMRQFNETHTAGMPSSDCGWGPEQANGIRFYSWTGTSPFTNPLDPSDYAFGIASLLADGASDGLVPRCSAHFGTVIRDDFRMNHGDEINQVLGLAAIFGPNPITPYRTQGNRLKTAGL